MKTYTFNKIKVEYHNCPCCKGMEPPASYTYEDPIRITTTDNCTPEMVIQAYMGGDATIVEFDYEVHDGTYEKVDARFE